MLGYNGKPMGGKGGNGCASGEGFQKMRYYTCKVSRESKKASVPQLWGISDNER